MRIVQDRCDQVTNSMKSKGLNFCSLTHFLHEAFSRGEWVRIAFALFVQVDKNKGTFLVSILPLPLQGVIKSVVHGNKVGLSIAMQTLPGPQPDPLLLEVHVSAREVEDLAPAAKCVVKGQKDHPILTG